MKKGKKKVIEKDVQVLMFWKNFYFLLFYSLGIIDRSLSRKKKKKHNNTIVCGAVYIKETHLILVFYHV